MEFGLEEERTSGGGIGVVLITVEGVFDFVHES